jgi:CDP-paratose 2-epimerase
MHALITGGAGFIGSNLAKRMLERGWQVTIFDNLSRPGVTQNLEWITALGYSRLQILVADVRNMKAVSKAVAEQTVVVHLASQVAVTTSVLAPRPDLEVNLVGTFNVLEAIRLLPEGARPALIFTSTNKVYGRIANLPLSEQGRRYGFTNSTKGVSESQALDFHSPYGCSKGAADQYVRDYARIYGLATVVFRMSCIYGPRQFGTEDQGWVAHLLISALLGKPITIYGDGKQVRDILFVADLLDAFMFAIDRMDRVRGEVFNIGGGPENTISLLELLDWLARRSQTPISRAFSDWRPGDQPVYISDVTKAQQKLNWTPRVTIAEGLEMLWEWIQAHREMFSVDETSTPGEQAYCSGVITS